MNFLWYIYLGGVADNLSNILTCLSILGGAALAFWAFVYSMGDAEKPPEKWMYFTVCVMAVFACLMPSSRVLYTAAAIDAGHVVAETDTGKKAIAALNLWLDSKTK